MGKKSRVKTQRPNVVFIGIFYKNSSPGGLGLSITPKCIDLNEFLKQVSPLSQKFIRNYKAMYPDNTLEDYLDECESQCREAIAYLGRHQNDLSKIDDQSVTNILVTSFVNVETLVQFGRIPNDEYNGTCFVSENVPYSTPKLTW